MSDEEKIAAQPASEAEPVISIKGLRKVFRAGFWGRKVEALKGLDLDVRPNEIFGFLGPNGAGKTTTIKAILRLIYPSSGSIKLFGKPNNNVPIRGRIGFLPENPYFYDYLTAKEFMSFYGQLLSIGRAERAAKSKELLRMVGLEAKEDLQLRKFSKGMVQRVGLAQALLNDPDLVVLDEPMSGLDPLGRKEIRDVIVNLKKAGKTVFFSTHILPDVEMICDRVGIIREGRIVSVGTLDEILHAATQGVEVTVKGVKFSDLPAEGVANNVLRGDTLHITLDDASRVDNLIRVVLGKGGSVIEVSPRRESLESYFMRSFDAHEDKKEGAPQ